MEEEEGTIIINQRDYRENVTERFSMKDFKSAYTPGEGPNLYLYQSKENLLDEEEKNRCQPITGVVVYLGKVWYYDILFAIKTAGEGTVQAFKSLHASGQELSNLVGPQNVSIT